jgi:hypothetical protein
MSREQDYLLFAITALVEENPARNFLKRALDSFFPLTSKDSRNFV